MSSVRAAHIRAAKVNPAYRQFEVYAQATDATHGRPVADRFELVGTEWGRLRFLDVDTLSKTLGGEVGDAVATILADWPDTPDALKDADGNWYAVKSGLGLDSLGVGTKLAVRRWAGDVPVIQNGTP